MVSGTNRALAVDGYNDDTHELVDIPQVRSDGSGRLADLMMMRE